MTLRKPTCAQTLQNNLAELQRRKDLESLRFFLQHEHCLPPHCDPATVVITMEELKKLARAWKLHERRNFWKQHSQKTEMVQALLQHIDDTDKLSAMRAREQSKLAAQNAALSPRPPSKPRPSHYVEGKSPFRENICGYTYFNLDRSPKLIVTNSRFLEGPRSDNAIDYLVDKWRGEDFNLRPDLAEDSIASSASAKSKARKSSILTVSAAGGGGDSGAASATLTIAEKLIKHRNLAAHLANFSKMLKGDPTNPGKAVMDMKTAQTFTNVAETDDSMVATYCIIALSNISVFPSVRAMLFEMNALHKVVSLLPTITDSTAHWAASIMFYYFSCDNEIEDRVFNVCMSSLQNSMSNQDVSSDVHGRLVNLYTLSNLLASIVDRLRITEMILPFIRQQCAPLRAGNAPRIQRSRTPSRPSSKVAQSRPTSKASVSRPSSSKGAVAAALSTSMSGDLRPQNTKELDDTLMMFLTIIYNVASFTNTHGALLSHRVVDVLADIALWSVLYQKGDLAFAVSRVMVAMVMSHDLMKNTESADFASVFGDLLQVDDPRVVHYCLRGLAIMSGVRALLDCVCDASLLTALSRVLGGDDQIIEKENALDVAKFLANISQFELEADSPLNKHIVVVTLQLIRKPKVDSVVKTIAVRALQNMYAVPTNCDPYDSTVVESVKVALQIAQKMDYISAIYTLYNISSGGSCATMLATNEVHMQVLQLIHSTSNPESKSAYLEVLVQIVGHTECVNDLLQKQLIQILFQEIRRKDCPQSVKYDTCRMLLAVVATDTQLTAADNKVLIDILKVVCKSEDLNREVSSVVAVVLAFLSLDPLNFEDANTIIHATLSYIEDETLQTSVATTLYNMTCDDDCLAKLVTDAGYLNTMIYLMRNSLQDVQLIVSETMRTLSALAVTVKLLVENDLLSDLVVVALLRTTSLDIKYACIGGFYNMLCHSETRLELVRGELWWAMMRLGKTDSDEMRHIFAQATFYLSCEAANVEPLRNHHVISFLKDVVQHGCTLDFLETVMRAILNMYGHMGKGHFTLGELASVVHLSTEITAHSQDILLVTNCLAVLVKSIQSHMKESAEHGTEEATTSLLEELDSEFVNADFVRVLTNTKDFWSSDPSCRLYVSSLLRDLTASRAFTQAFPLADIGDVLDAAYTNYPSKEVGENVVTTIYRCVFAERKESLSVLSNLDIWANIKADVLKVPRWLDSGSVGNIQSRRAFQDSNSADGDVDIGNPEIDYSFEAKTAVIAVLSVEVDQLLKTPEKVPLGLVEGLLQKEYVMSNDTAENLQYIIQALSTHPETAGRLFDCDVIRILRRLLARAVASAKKLRSPRSATATAVTATASDEEDEGHLLEQNVCTAVLRNLSLHRKVLRKLAAVKDTDLNLLIEELLMHDAGDHHLLDISILLYKAATYVLKPEFMLNPQFVLDTCKSILEKTTNITIESIVKSVVGIVLEKFSFGMAVDPIFVQSMFTELTSSVTMAVTQQMAQVSFEKVESLHSDMEKYHDRLLQPTKAYIDVFAAAEDMWEPLMLRQKKKLQKTVLLESAAEPRKHETLEPSEQIVVPVFSKIVKEYDRVTPDNSMLTLVSLEDMEDDDLDPSSVEGLKARVRRLSSMPGMGDLMRTIDLGSAPDFKGAPAGALLSTNPSRATMMTSVGGENEDKEKEGEKTKKEADKGSSERDGIGGGGGREEEDDDEEGGEGLTLQEAAAGEENYEDGKDEDGDQDQRGVEYGYQDQQQWEEKDDNTDGDGDQTEGVSGGGDHGLPSRAFDMGDLDRAIDEAAGDVDVDVSDNAAGGEDAGDYEEAVAEAAAAMVAEIEQETLSGQDEEKGEGSQRGSEAQDQQEQQQQQVVQSSEDGEEYGEEEFEDD